jgi:D-alanyl-lipoteichoic acid acyltransferase DltB (MBOAT superfamily)
MNVGLLASLKYMPFLLGNWAAWTGRPAPEWHWTFPLGVSFYTFQALTYTIDIYRKDTKHTRSLLAYLSAVSFFPTTLAGPITRVGSLLPQLEKRKELADSEGGRALFRIALGAAKKFLIADYLAENLVNRVFDFPNLYSGAEVLTGIYAYALQLYFDFSGYTDIAIGSALLLGIKLPENFNQPYSARNLAEFWRRWHISLSNWLRDYLFYAFPGKRTLLMPYVALIVTMVIGGLWHGPSWTFVIWGLLHGIGQAVVRAWQAVRGSEGSKNPLAILLSQFATLQFVCFAWIYFRASSIENAHLVIARAVSGTVSFDNVTLPVAVVIAVAAAGHYFPLKWRDSAAQGFAWIPFPLQAMLLAGLVLALQYVANTGAAPFIYTRF